ncbi:MAG: ATP-binding protein [Streptosporangiaceae bacterium]
MGTLWSFAGREAELDRIRAALTAGDGALVTGPDGVGKSRLLTEAGHLGLDGLTMVQPRAGQALSSPFGAFAHLLPISAPVEDVALGVETVLARAGSGALLLIADDLHDFDEQSALLLRGLAGSGRARLLASMPAGATAPAVLAPVVAALVPVQLDPLPAADVLRGAADEESTALLAQAAGGDLRLLAALLRAGRSTGVFQDGHWTGPIRGTLEESLARALLLGIAGRAQEAETVLSEAVRRPEDSARAAFACARAANLAWGLGRDEDADRVLGTALDTITTDRARQWVLVQKATAALHRADSRAALDLADDAAAVIPPDGVNTGRIAVVESLAAALTGQSTAALEKVRTGLSTSADWAVRAPECGPLLEFARASVWLSVGDLDAAGERSGPDEDSAARAAVQARVLRARGKIHGALRQGWDGVRMLRGEQSLFAGPCLGELAHAAALAGDLATARDALAEADLRALPTLRALWFPVALARPWLLVAQGAVGAAVHGLLDAAAAAEALELRPYALAALHDVVRLGAAGVVADRIAALAEDAEGDLAPLCARHAEAAAAGDWSGLIGASFEFEELGMMLHSAEAAAQAAEVHWDRGQAAAAGTRAWVMVQRCDQVRTPALRTAAVPDLTRVQYEIAELVASGVSETAIAEQVSLPVRAVADQLVEICQRLGVSGPDRLSVLLSPAE